MYNNDITAKITLRHYRLLMSSTDCLFKANLALFQGDLLAMESLKETDRAVTCCKIGLMR